MDHEDLSFYPTEEEDDEAELDELDPINASEVSDLLLDADAAAAAEEAALDGEPDIATSAELREAAAELAALNAEAAAAEDREAEENDGEDRWVTDDDLTDAAADLAGLNADTAAAEDREEEENEGDDRWVTDADVTEAAHEARELNLHSFLAGGRLTLGALALAGLGLTWRCNLADVTMGEAMDVRDPVGSTVKIFSHFIGENVRVSEGGSGANELTRLVFVALFLTACIAYDVVRARVATQGTCSRIPIFSLFHWVGLVIAFAFAFPAFLYIDGPRLRSRRSLSRADRVGRLIPNPLRCVVASVLVLGSLAYVVTLPAVQWSGSSVVWYFGANTISAFGLGWIPQIKSSAVWALVGSVNLVIIATMLALLPKVCKKKMSFDLISSLVDKYLLTALL